MFEEYEEVNQDEQKALEEFGCDMRDFDKCVIHYELNGNHVIACRLGLWKVESRDDDMKLINEAVNYFEQYKGDGEYHAFIGGKTPIEVMRCER